MFSNLRLSPIHTSFHSFLRTDLGPKYHSLSKVRDLLFELPPFWRERCPENLGPPLGIVLQVSAVGKSKNLAGKIVIKHFLKDRNSISRSREIICASSPKFPAFANAHCRRNVLERSWAVLMQIHINHYIYGLFRLLNTFFFFSIKIKYTFNFFTWNVGLKLQTQAPKEANFYESQRIALKLKSIHSLLEKFMLY